MMIWFDRHDLARVTAFVDEMIAVKPNIRRVDFTERERRGNEMSGKFGEIAFGRAFGGWPVDWTVRAEGDAGGDFILADGRIVDVKGVWVQKNMNYDFQIPLEPGKVVADFYVQVLVASDFSYGHLTGGISRDRFLRVATTERAWGRRGTVEPLVVRRSQLSTAYPPEFWYTPAVGSLSGAGRDCITLPMADVAEILLDEDGAVS